MAKPKNQTALIDSYVKGATSGTVGHLLIQGDTLYNTENEEYLPVSRRLGPAGNTQYIIINTEYAVHHHGMYRYHKETVETAIYELNNQRPSTQRHGIKYIPMKITASRKDKHPIPEDYMKAAIDQSNISIKTNEEKIGKIKAEIYIPTTFETRFSDAELIEASEQLIKDCRTYIEYLTMETSQLKATTQIQDIEELVNAPQIMEQAIENGGIDPIVLQRMLATRDRVQEIITSVEKHIAIILSIPSEPRSGLNGREAGDIIVDEINYE